MRYAAAVVAAALLLSGAACGGGEVEVDSGPTGASLQLPSQIVGLRLVPERVDQKDLEKIDRPYVDNIAVFSLREDDLLRATLQIARFNRLARPEDAAFQGSIVGVLGGQRPIDLVVAGKEVNATTGTSQNIFSWFGGRGMFILSVQQDYPFPRTLLRRLIERDLAL